MADRTGDSGNSQPWVQRGSSAIFPNVRSVFGTTTTITITTHNDKQQIFCPLTPKRRCTICRRHDVVHYRPTFTTRGSVLTLTSLGHVGVYGALRHGLITDHHRGRVRRLQPGMVHRLGEYLRERCRRQVFRVAPQSTFPLDLSHWQ